MNSSWIVWNGYLPGGLMIRLAVGFFITFGAVGRLDVDPTASLLNYTLLAFLGLAIMAWPIFDGSITEIDE